MSVRTATFLRWARRLGALLLVAAAAWVTKDRWLTTPPVPVTVFRAAPGLVEETVTNSRAGTVKTRRRATLSPEMGGRVEVLAVHEGDRVRRGQLLLRLTATEYAAQVALQERAVRTAEATEREACEAADLASREAARVKTLVADGIASPQQLDQLESRREAAVAACAAARARVAQAEAAVRVARVTQSKTELRAPFDGTVARVSTQVGEWITPSPPGLPIPPVIEVLDTEAIYVQAPLDEVDVAKVVAGMPVRVTMDAFPGRALTARLVRVAPFVEDRQEQNRTFDVEIELDDRAFARMLLPGTSADVEVILRERRDVLRVPAYALLQGDRVLVVRGDTLVSVAIGTGLRNWDFVEVTRGLSAGDAVVVSLDRAEVREGARVTIQAEAAR